MNDFIGIGVMISDLRGNYETLEAIKVAQGKEISSIVLEEDRLFIGFVDECKIKIFDDGQSCCEHRYMTTDDDLSYNIGSKFLGVEVAGAPDREDGYGVHEVQFLKVKTSLGVFTIETHNEHNGYYGGFSIRAEEVTL